MAKIGIADTAILSVLGYAVVFFGIALLMGVVMLLGKVMSGTQKKPAAAPVAVEAAPEVSKPTAPGTAGQLKLHDVEPKTAAMLMAIVADKMGKPINELRFISIKEVK